MKRISLILLCIITFLPVFAGRKADKNTLKWRYEIQNLGIMSQDGKTVTFKIWSYDKKEDVALLQASKNAVHAVIFKQIDFMPPLAGTESIEEEHKDFFKDFFKDRGEYMRFVQLANNGAIAPSDKIKFKKFYKIGVKVRVNKEDLRKYLEKKGIIAKMNSFF